MSHTHHHGHHHGHVHRHGPNGEWHSHDHGDRPHHHEPGDHAIGRLSPTRLWTPKVHRIGRRGFLTELGRKSFALAIVGLGAAACSGDDDTATAPDPTSAPDPTATTAPDPTATAAPEEAEQEPMADEAIEALRWSQVSLGFVSAYVLVRGSEAAVVDTGNPGSADDIGSALQTLGVGWDEVRHVILTHSHGDHVGGLSEVLGEAPTAITYAGEGDIDAIRAPNPLTAVGDGDEVLGLQVIETPGHTPGSISVLDTGIGLLVAGDALNTDDAGTVVTGPNPRFTPDMDTANESVAKLASSSSRVWRSATATPSSRVPTTRSSTSRSAERWVVRLIDGRRVSRLTVVGRRLGYTGASDQPHRPDLGQPPLASTRVLAHQLGSDAPPHRGARPDLVISTGDMVIDDPDEADTRAFARAQFDRLPCPWLVVPGNHDVGDGPPTPWQDQPVTEERVRAFIDTWGMDRFVHDIEGWRLVGINGLLLGSGLAAMETAQDQWLEQALGSAGGRRLAVFAHKPLYNHHPTEPDTIMNTPGAAVAAPWSSSDATASN